MIVDGTTTVFDSSAILLDLADKTGQFLPAQHDRGALLSWMMFVASGIGPFTGQCVHFKHDAPEKLAYAIQRYEFEAWRHWKIIDAHLAGKTWMLGETYSVLDMAVWGWARAIFRTSFLRRPEAGKSARARSWCPQGGSINTRRLAWAEAL